MHAPGIKPEAELHLNFQNMFTSYDKRSISLWFIIDIQMKVVAVVTAQFYFEMKVVFWT